MGYPRIEVDPKPQVLIAKAKYISVSAHTMVHDQTDNFATLFIFLMPNVRGQGTRHFVEGTLDPIVRRFILLMLKCLAFVPTQ